MHRQNIQEATDGIRRHLIAVREPDDLKTVLDIELVRELDLLGIPIDSLSIRAAHLRSSLYWTIVFGIAVVLFLIVEVVVGGAGDIVDMVRSLLKHREKTEAEIGRDKS